VFPPDIVYGFCSSGRGKVYAVGEGVTVIDASADTIVATIPGCGGYSDIIYDAVHDKVYCNSPEGVAVVDAAADTILETIDLLEPAAAPSGLVWSPSRNRVYAAHTNASAISVIVDETVDLERFPVWPRPKISAATLVGPGGAIGAEEASIMDIAGRRVATLARGVNHPGELAPGVYFVHYPTGSSGIAPSVRKVIVAP